MATKTRSRNGAKSKASAKAAKPAKSTKPAKAANGSKAVKAASNGARATKAASNGAKSSRAPARLSLTTLGYAIVFVRDMDRGIAFYRDTLGIPLRFGSPEWSEFEMKGFTLALHHADTMPSGLDQAAIPELCFSVEDVRGTRAQLISRGLSATELHSVCDLGDQIGACSAFRDPDGNHLSVFGMVPKSEWTGPADCC